MNFRRKYALSLGFVVSSLSFAGCSADRNGFQQISQDRFQLITADNHCDRHTYQNQNFNFSFSYPSDYILVNKDIDGISLYLTLWSQKDYQYMQSDRSKQDIHGPLRNVRIAVYPNRDRLSPLDWLQTNDNSTFSTIRLGNYKNINFAGRPAISYTWCGLGCTEDIIFSSGDDRYIFKLGVSYDYGNELDLVRNDFEVVTSTFKFQ